MLTKIIKFAPRQINKKIENVKRELEDGKGDSCVILLDIFILIFLYSKDGKNNKIRRFSNVKKRRQTENQKYL